MILQIVYCASPAKMKERTGEGVDRGRYPVAAGITPRIPRKRARWLQHILFGYLAQQPLHDATEAQHGRGGGKMPLGVILCGAVHTPRR